MTMPKPIKPRPVWHPVPGAWKDKIVGGPQGPFEERFLDQASMDSAYTLGVAELQALWKAQATGRHMHPHEVARMRNLERDFCEGEELNGYNS
jgi:hypothetical protein